MVVTAGMLLCCDEVSVRVVNWKPGPAYGMVLPAHLLDNLAIAFKVGVVD